MDWSPETIVNAVIGFFITVGLLAYLLDKKGKNLFPFLNGNRKSPLMGRNPIASQEALDKLCGLETKMKKELDSFKQETKTELDLKQSKETCGLLGEKIQLIIQNVRDAQEVIKDEQKKISKHVENQSDLISNLIIEVKGMKS